MRSNTSRRDRHQIGMRHPGAVIAVAHLALLVGAHLGECGFVRGLIVFDRNLRRHAAHRERAAEMTGLHQQRRVGAEERLAHHHLPAIGEDVVLMPGELLDEGKDEIPAPGIEPCDVVAQLVEDFLHLECGGQRFDQHGRADRAVRNAEPLPREHEHIIPEPRFLVRLQLGQIEIGAGAVRDLRLRIMEKERPKSNSEAGDRLAIDGEMLFEEMPAARAHDQHGRLVGKLITLVSSPDR